MDIHMSNKQESLWHTVFLSCSSRIASGGGYTWSLSKKKSQSLYLKIRKPNPPKYYINVLLRVQHIQTVHYYHQIKTYFTDKCFWRKRPWITITQKLGHTTIISPITAILYITKIQVIYILETLKGQRVITRNMLQSVLREKNSREVSPPASKGFTFSFFRLNLTALSFFRWKICASTAFSTALVFVPCKISVFFPDSTCKKFPQKM